MRHFILDNGTAKTDENGVVTPALLDITTTDILFYEISGLGFDEDNTFKRIGRSWTLSKTEYQQGLISGKIIFNCGETLNRDDDPYYRYMQFVQYVSKPPLILRYYPFGYADDTDDVYYRKVRVSKLSKTEKNEYGVLDCDIEFTPYTPWYKIVTAEFVPTPPQVEEHHWIWDTPVVFSPETEEQAQIPVPAGAIRPIFDVEPEREFRIPISGLEGMAPTKLTIEGPLLNPYWTHSMISGERITTVSSGGFITSSQDGIEIGVGESLVIDNTDGNYSIVKVASNGSTTDLYSRRNFGLGCFVSLRNGTNLISVGTELSSPPSRIIAEAHKLYATV